MYSRWRGFSHARENSTKKLSSASKGENERRRKHATSVRRWDSHSNRVFNSNPFSAPISRKILQLYAVFTQFVVVNLFAEREKVRHRSANRMRVNSGYYKQYRQRKLIGENIDNIVTILLYFCVYDENAVHILKWSGKMNNLFLL